ncbi:MAG: hypothetical protein R3305_03335 [Gammaproteobacteria bacterium]|nr:hypothetical protein [Gammaproteobacteria bacterium]
MAPDRDSEQELVIADDWADRYGALRHHGPGHVSAWLGTPLAIASLVGMLWSAPLPDALSNASPAVNWGTLFLMATFVYYCILSISLALGALPVLILLAIPSAWLDRAGLPLWPLASALFATAFAWQLVETRVATGRARPIENLQYLMLGPIWLLRALYRRFGLAY